MRIAKLIIGLLLMMPAWAQAHTHLEQSSPVDNSVGAAPREVMLKFAHPVRLTALSVQLDGSDQLQKLGPLPESASAQLTIPAPVLKSGKYVMTWRAVGDDGHIMSGTIRFTVRGP